MHSDLQELKDILYKIKHTLQEEQNSEYSLVSDLAKMQLPLVDKMLLIRASIALYN